MFIAAIILIVSTGLLLFYLHVFCQKFLRRRDTQEFYPVIVNANRWGLPTASSARRPS